MHKWLLSLGILFILLPKEVAGENYPQWRGYRRPGQYYRKSRPEYYYQYHHHPGVLGGAFHPFPYTYRFGRGFRNNHHLRFGAMPGGQSPFLYFGYEIEY